MTPLLAPRLRPWTGELAVLSQVALEGLGPWLPPLAAAVGPRRAPTQAVTGDPDGFGGLQRRGHYERLLLSEWLLATEQPDEFLRRAIMHEHAFLAPQYRDEGGGGPSLALLDAGPQQLGAPRLAQLALLVVLARRAAEAHAPFEFGLLQDGQLSLHHLDAAGLRAWTAARTGVDAQAHADAWRDRVRTLATDDVWIVGGARALELCTALGAHGVSIEQHEDPSSHVLHVHTRPRDRVSHRVALNLPEEPIALGLLRNPVAAAPSHRTARRLAGDRQLGRLCSGGQRLLVPAHRCVVAHHVPSHPAGGTGKPRAVDELGAYSVLGVDVVGAHLVALHGCNGELVLAGSGLRSSTGLPQNRSTLRSLGSRVHLGTAIPGSFEAGDDRRLCELIVIERRESGFDAWVLDRTSQLYRLKVVGIISGKPRTHLERVEASCCDFTQVVGRGVAWRSGTDGVAHARLPEQSWKLGGDGAARCVFASHGGTTWIGIDRGDAIEVRGAHDQRLPRGDGALVGFLWRYTVGPTPTPMFVLLADDGRTLTLHGRDTSSVLLTTGAPIESVRFEPAWRRLVYLTKDGEHGVYAFDAERVVWRRTFEQGRG